MANIIKTQIQFRRDTTANWEAYKDIVPAAGEPCFDIELGTLKIGNGINTYGELEPIGSGVAVSADGKSLVLDDGVFKLVGFDDAEVGAQPRKNADGFIEWVVPSAETSDGLQIAVDALQEDVTDLQLIVGTTEGEVSGTLLDRVSALETDVNTLNGDKNTNGSVRQIVNEEINIFANKISDDGVVNTLKELVDYVAAHGTETADMAADITALQGLVGDTKVSDQIAVAVAGKVDAQTGKGLSTNDFTDSLLEKLDGIEVGAQVNKIDEVYLGETLLDVVDKKVVIPVGAGLKTSDEIEIAADGTISIKSISIDKIAQDEDSVLIMDGGGAV